MSNKSSINGKAYEFAYVLALQEYLKIEIEQNSSFKIAQNAFFSLDKVGQDIFLESAKAGVKKILELEPSLFENERINLKIQDDKQGEIGDVRDIVFGYDGYEIGVSAKHNHFAVKHSRLSGGLDFGKKWYGIPCSKEYFDDISPIFEFLKQEKANRIKWRDIKNKDSLIYLPILTAFQKEVKFQNQKYNIATKMIEYMLGVFDFYKAIGIDKDRRTQIMVFNLRGTLNKQGKIKKSFAILPVASLPTRIISFDFKPKSKNTLELYLDNGWSLKFRIHSASTKVEPSLKFDVGLMGVPTTIISFNCFY